MGEELFFLFIGFGTPVTLLLLGLTVGKATESGHLRRLASREAETSDVLVTQIKSFPFAGRSRQPPTVLFGEAIIGTDYFKSFLAQFRKIFGGEMKMYRLLMERARREALLRIVEQAKEMGYNAVCNVRFQTADVGGSTSMKQVAMASILATATAYHADRAVR